MTYRSDSDSDSATGRRFENVEITPEMIEAGIEAISLFKLSEDEFSLILSEIYRAMATAAPVRERTAS